MTKLLSPAGDLECFYAAISAGADEIYAGADRFGARAYAANFTREEFAQAIDYAHLMGKKLYLTLNTLIRPSEFEEAVDYIRYFYKEGLDGVIIQDLGMARYLRREFADLPLHGSTQMAVMSRRGAAFLREMGFSRVVPARELSFEELREIRDSSDIEMEVFVHGAMCYSYSGMCLMSSMFGGRSANRGRCAGSCRRSYELDGEEGYWLSMKDMCAVELLYRLVGMQVDSLKIEGRMKSASYVYGVTGIYRKYLDDCLQAYGECETGTEGGGRTEGPGGAKGMKTGVCSVRKEDIGLLERLYSRGESSRGYFEAHNGRDMLTISRGSYTSSKESIKIERPRIPVRGRAYIHSGEPMRLELYCGEARAENTGRAAEEARTQPMRAGQIKEQLMKSGGSFADIGQMEVDVSENVFVAKAELNDLRRGALEALKKKLLEGFKR